MRKHLREFFRALDKLAVKRNQYVMGIDLDTWRRKQKMSWDKLAKIVGLPITTVRRFALGMATIATERVDTILTVTHGEVDLYAMHRKRMDYIRRTMPDGVPHIPMPDAAPPTPDNDGDGKRSAA